MPLAFSPLWTYALPAPPLGLALARETGVCLVWDRHSWIFLLNQRGQLQAQVRFPQSVAAAALADTGAAACVLGSDGLVHWFGRDLALRREDRLPSGRGTALALDPFGHTLAAADDQASIHIWRDSSPPVTGVTFKTLLHLAIVPAQALVVGSADFGLVAGIDLDGGMQWRDTPLANVGDLSVDGAGDSILLASFSEGIQRWGKDGKKKERLQTPGPCRLLAQSYDGQRILAADMDRTFWLMNGQGESLAEGRGEATIVDLNLASLGDRAWFADAGGEVRCFRITP